MIATNLFLIAVCCVIVIDISGIIDHIKKWIWKWVWKNDRPYQDFELKPIDCSFCSNFWVSLGYLIISGTWTLPLMALALFFSYLTPVIKDVLYVIKDFIIRMIGAIYDYFSL